jgi:hypothetical protein
MQNQLYRNLGTGRFEDVSSRGGAAFQLSDVGRGAAFGDIDNDGDTDVVVGNASGPIRLLVNNVGNQNHWIGLRLVGRSGGSSAFAEASADRRSLGGGRLDPPERDMLGARVEIRRQNGPTLWRRARSDGSYASANDPRVIVGLGTSQTAPSVRVHWPSGKSEEWASVAIDRYTTLREGSGQ